MHKFLQPHSSSVVYFIPKPYTYDVHVFMRLLHGGVLVDDGGSNVANVCLVVGTLGACVSWH